MSASVSDEESTLQLRVAGGSVCGTPAGSPRALRRDPSILKGAGSFRRRPPGDPPNVTFNVENEQDSDDDGQITFSARPHASRGSNAPRSRPSSLLVAAEDVPDATGLGRLAARSRSVEDSTNTGSPIVDLKLRGLRRTAEILRKVSSAERLTRLRDKIMSRGGGSRERSPARDELSDDESAPLVSPGGAPPSTTVARPPSSGPPSEASTLAGTEGGELSPRSDVTELESPRDVGAAFDLLPAKDEADSARVERAERLARADSSSSVSNMVEPYNMRLLAHGTSDSARALWRQDALDAGPPWPWDEPDSAV